MKKINEYDELFKLIESEYGLGIIPLYKAYPPLMKYEGYAYLGVLLLDTQTNRLQCHKCGKWYLSLTAHLWAKHHIRATDYKVEIGFNMGTSLVSPELTANNMENGKKMYEYNNLDQKRVPFKKGQNSRGSTGLKKDKASIQKRNMSNTCPAQLKHRFELMIQELGRIPTKKEFENRVNIRDYYKTYNDAVIAFGYVPNRVVRRRVGRSWGKNDLLNTIIMFMNTYHREPFTHDTVQKLLPSTGTFKKYFGSFKNAKKEALNNLNYSNGHNK